MKNGELCGFFKQCIAPNVLSITSTVMIAISYVNCSNYFFAVIAGYFTKAQSINSITRIFILFFFRFVDSDFSYYYFYAPSHLQIANFNVLPLEQCFDEWTKGSSSLSSFAEFTEGDWQGEDWSLLCAGHDGPVIENLCSVNIVFLSVCLYVLFVLFVIVCLFNWSFFA